MLQIKIILLIIMTILPFALSRYAKYKVRQRRFLALDNTPMTVEETTEEVSENETPDEGLSPQKDISSPAQSEPQNGSDFSPLISSEKDVKSYPSSFRKSKKRKRKIHSKIISNDKTRIEEIPISFDDIQLK